MHTFIKSNLFFTLFFSIFISVTQADDTEIFFSPEVSRVNPNVLFVLDVSGSMDETVDDASEPELRHYTFVKKITNPNDDAEEKLNNGNEVSLGSSDLELVKDGSNKQMIGLRFRNITIPKDATITNATIQFQVDETKPCDGKKVRIFTQSSNNASEFNSNNNNLSNRGKYTPAVNWFPENWDTVDERGVNQKTPNLKTIVQKVIDRSGWKKGNAMVFLMKGGNGTAKGQCTAESYNGDSDAAPELTIEYDALTPPKNRLQVMQSALKTVLDNAPTNLNVGLMNYGEITESDQSLGIKFPVKNIEDLAFPIVSESLPIDEWNNREWWRSNIPEPSETVVVRTYLSQITDWFWKDNWYEEKYEDTPVREMDHVGATPIVEALYEAALYFRGEPLGWGHGEAGFWEDGRAPSHPASYEGDAIKWDDAICNDTWTKWKWGGENEQNSHIDFANNEQDWMNCPADANNPSGIGNYANCAGTEVCNTYQGCPSGHWVSGTSGHCNSYSEPDETGNTHCTDYTSGISGHCDTEDRVTKYRCKYQVCEGGLDAHPNYISPITQSCQRNFIVLLSDGKPEYSYDWDEEGNRDGTNSQGPTYWQLKDQNWSGLEDKTNNSIKFDDTNCANNLTPFGYASGACGSELTHFLSNNDQSSIDGLQTVDTYAIGFGLGAEANASAYLQSLVTTTDGYFEADDEENLSTAFGNILSNVSATTSAYASPGYTVNMRNTTENEDYIFIPVFDKKLSPKWPGNLKKFKLVNTTDDEGRGLRKIQGKNNLDAVSELGEFSDDALDYWSTSNNANPDGYFVEKGGVAGLLNPANRKLYSDLSCASYPCSLISSANHLKESNASDNGSINNTVLAIDSGKDAVYRKKLIKFIMGYDSDNNARKQIGDILHSAPITFTYKKGAADGTGKEQYIFVATNEGYLHIFDTKTGVEKFAFMPKALLKNIETQYLDNETGGHRYGIDGQLSLWHNDANKNHEVDNNEKVYLYFGLRRGGRAYYALDISDLSAPSLAWKISNADSDFSNLGYTWSKAHLASIRKASDKTLLKVAIFTGGYDINQDDEANTKTNVNANYGNDIFIVNATTGSLLWSLQSSAVDGAASLEHSIPGGVRILDLNRNGAIDRMYFADTGGNIWRLDLNEELNETDENNKSVLIKLASFGGTGINARKFYNEPDVSMFKHKGRSVLALSIGSGYRAHPMNKELKDHFFTILDKATFRRINMDTFSTINLNDTDMAKVAVTINADGTKSLNYNALNETDLLAIGKRGWYVDFASTGEKVLANAITVDGTVSFTTFVPSAEASSVGAVVDLCSAPSTQGRLYGMNILTGKPTYDLDWSGGSPTETDVFTTVSSNEIPGAPQRVFNSFECSDGQCEHTVDIRVGKKLVQSSSYDRSYLESVYWSDPN